MPDINGDVFEMRLGLPGQGKTLTQNEKIVIPALLEGLDVYVNYWVNWNLPNLHVFQDFEEIADVRNCVVVFDEIGQVLDPRNWENESGNVRRFFQLHRHRHVEIYGTTQHLSLVAKSSLIIVDRFLVCTKSHDGFIFKRLGLPFSIEEEEKTLKELKQDEAGYIPFQNYDDDFDFVQSSVYWYSPKNLIHSELDEYKLEFIHWYCPRCQKRQGELIDRKDCYFDLTTNLWKPRDKTLELFCPKHKDIKLEYRQSPMYDTDYELEVEQKEVIFRPFVKTLKESPYRGALTRSQLEHRRKLESSL